ncbi:hypothetical protein BWQ96_10117 [Gracilariopsis chorda]|uniref:Uncharacterized protein n=1 Tax=Gracilariopsis chorda TaxID=448386 RepID=A0A2V3IDL4_9FLOR|nr:hypothetical protein BWQ96_10117 [Gracilariopsis chorda]|eukprot:PXF40179.1 hypothetical protein BWQ96_10117 [Gracilariopsis chorda]
MPKHNNYAKVIPVLISAAAAVLCTAFFGKRKSGHGQTENATEDPPEDGRQLALGTAAVENVKQKSSSICPQVSNRVQEPGPKLGSKIEGRLKALITKVSTIREDLRKTNEALSNTKSPLQSLETATPAPQEHPDAPLTNSLSDFLAGVEPDSSEDWCTSGSSGSFLEVMDLPPPATLTDEDKNFFLSTLAAGASDGPYAPALPGAKPVEEEEARNVQARMDAIRLCAFQGAQVSAIAAIDPNGDAWTPALGEARRGSAESREDRQLKHRRQQVVYDLDEI